MKVFYLTLFVLVGLSLSEIVPRFPGTQPLIFDFTGVGNGTTTGQTEVKLIIDTFEVESLDPVVIILSGPVPPEVTQSKFDQGSSIVGTERDISFTVQDGTNGQVFSCSSSGGSFSVSTPNGGSGFALLQYDGIDGSINLSTNPGLGGLDLTENGATGFEIVAVTDVDSEFTVTLVDGSGREFTAGSEVPGTKGQDPSSYTLLFSDFPGAVDFTDIVAIEFLVEAFENVDFNLLTFNTFGPIIEEFSNCYPGVVAPCDTDYYRLQALDDVLPGDYVTISFTSLGEPSHADSGTHFYLVGSKFEDLQTELATNEHILDTLGALPGPTFYDYKCENNCELEIVWSSLKNLTYYIAVEGTGPGLSTYEFCINRREVPITQIFDSVSLPVFRDRRVNTPPEDFIRHYSHYLIDVPQARYSEGTYLVVNISRAEPFPGLKLTLMHESMAVASVQTGLIGAVDFNSYGNQVDQHTYQSCVDVTLKAGNPYYENPASYNPRVPCECFTFIQTFGSGPAYQLTCNVTVDPCDFRYGKWYASVELPNRAAPENANDTTGYANYTITAYVIQPSVTQLFRNVTFKGFVENTAATHYRLTVPASSYNAGDHLMIQVSNVRNGFVDIFVHEGNGLYNTLAGGPEGCSPANATCHTSDACNVIVEKCHFSPGNWYISVNVGYENGKFLIWDEDRVPITYTIRANWVSDPTPARILSGVPVSKYIGEGLYDFYVLNIPPTVDTWLFVELYAKAEDTEVIISMLHGELPGGDCYSRPDFYCMTGDPYDKRWTTGSPSFLTNDPVQRESCSFMIQTCELEAGPLYISVYGHRTGYVAYGDTTYYQAPVHYTLWVDFDSSLPLVSGVSYSEVVAEKQYQHYYIRADQVAEGSWLSVEVTNIQHGIPQTVEVYVNYNFLAGDCPCYDHLYNCTENSACKGGQNGEPFALPDVESVLNCCTIVVPSSDFRPGVWYIAVLGVNEDLFQYTTPIGYTLTATIHDAPTFNYLFLGQEAVSEVPQYNETYQYSHFKLAADAVPVSDLIFKVTWAQNCEFLGKHDDSTDYLRLFVNVNSPAGANPSGHKYWCETSVYEDSYCVVVVPHCEWNAGDRYFIAVQGDYSATFPARFTLLATLDEIRDYELTDNVPVYDRVSEGRYKHYFIHTTAEEDQYLEIDVYTNQDQDAISVYLNKDRRAGDVPCWDHTAVCETQTMCSWQLLACELEPGRYYISVRGANKQFYGISTEYTVLAAHRQVVTDMISLFPVTGHLYQPGQVRHYAIEIDERVPGTHLNFIVDNVKHGSVTAFLQFGYLSGRCPCFIHEKSCTAFSAATGEDGGNEWCEIRVPSCEVQVGTYYWSIWANELITPDPLNFLTPIGFTVEIDVWAPDIETPKVNVGRNVALTELAEVVHDDRYRHYGFTWTNEDVDAGYHVILEITDVRGGVLSVFYNPLSPGDIDTSCHLAEICTSGLSSGRTCYWQLPYCLVREAPIQDKHYITVHGESGRFFVFYKLLLWKQPVPSVVQNPIFTLDNATNANIFTSATELNVTHSKFVEPNGWTQFIKLSEVPARADSERGEMLELFFYRITNNPGEPIAFNVYVAPKSPPGAHGCCDETNDQEMGVCQNAPCSQTADTTTQVGTGPEIFSHTCSLGTGIGTNNGIPFYGQRCTVRVWPCEFNKYCFDETNDWYVSVVPLANTDPASTGAGLAYSFQWRTRNIRIEDVQPNVGTIDISPIINTYEFSTVFTVPSTTTENQGWRSFVVDWRETDSRLSIQTLFGAGSGIVYISGDEFASPTETCYDYICTSGEDCAGAQRFLVTECQSIYHNRYYITVRNTGGPQNNDLQVSFRITSTSNPSIVEIPSHPSRASPYIGNSTVSVYPNGVSGVQPENYDFYFLTIDDDDLDNYQSWIIEVSRPGGANDVGTLEVYIRFGAEAGSYGTSAVQGYYGDAVEGCHTWQYSCALPTDGVCRWQIPSCSLIEGHWHISIFNPDVNLNGIPSELPDYQIITYIDDAPVYLPLNSVIFVNSTQINTEFPEYLQHYIVNVTVPDVAFDDRNDISGYWTRWLRFQVDNITSGAVEYWINYDGLAGPTSEYACLKAGIANNTCASGCYTDVTPCELNGSVFKLKSGVYYISVRATGPYHLSAQMLDDVYTVIPITATIAGEGNRLGTSNDYYSYNVTQAELNVDGDGFGNYHYVIDTAINGTVGADDDLDDNQYIIINVTASIGTNSGASLNLEIWRDDCTRFNCALSGAESWCTVDALTLAPCSAKGGRFYFRAENPARVPFRIELYNNQTTIQSILDEQIITEIIFPYEYQEYFYEATEVGQGSTLTVTVCSICGEVEAWIRPDLPAGPSPDITGVGSSCAVDHCSIPPPSDTSFEERPNSCCELFLDTCEYKQRGWYIGVRGVATTFPSLANPNLYLPARYNIEAKQTTVNYTEISFARCAKTINYYDEWYDVPRQYTIDVETVNVGTQLKFSLRVPDNFHADSGASLHVNFNSSVGYSDGCPSTYLCTTGDSCSVVIPYCVLSAVGPNSRFYIWADAPRGSEVLVERWDPVVPIVLPNVWYSSTINGPSTGDDFDLPFRPNVQYYRFDLVPPHGDDNYYEKFFARIAFKNVKQGSISVAFTTGNLPYEYGFFCDIPPVTFSGLSCNGVESDSPCHYDIEYANIKDVHSPWSKHPPTTFWITVLGNAQDCELHSIAYDFVVQTNWLITYYPVDETNCLNVAPGEYNFHRLQPREVEHPQQSILHITINDLDSSDEVLFALHDSYLATVSGNDFSVSSADSADNEISFDWFCGYSDLYLSEFGQSSADGSIDYRMTVEKIKVPVKEVFDDSIYYADDDDDDACPHEHDFYIFRTAAPLGHHEGSFFRVLVDSLFNTKVYVNKQTIAWGPCHDSGYGENNPSETGTTSVNVYDFCDFEDGIYYITVVSDGPYYIYTDIRDDAKNLTLGEIYRDGLEPAEYQVYLLEICKDWFEPDDRLVVEIADVQNGDVYAWIRYEGTPGLRTSESGEASCAHDSTLALYGPPGQSGYNYLLVNSCDLQAGTYQILVRTSPHEGTPSRNLEKTVTYRLFPYLIDYQIDPVELIPNTIITDIVDFYYINRFDLQDSTKHINYYMFMPLMEDTGFFEGVSHAVARLLNVKGGLLRLSVSSEHLAIPQWAFIEGEIYGLTKNSEVDPHTHMQSTAHPFTYQQVIDSTTRSQYQPECTGCSDFCVDMTFNDIDVYTKDSSAAIWLPSCYLVWVDFFLAVEPLFQFAQDRSITYDLQVSQSHDYILIQPDTHHVAKFTDNNWDYDFYFSISAEPESMRWRVVVTGGEGVLVTVRNHRCPLQATWVKEVWVDAAYYDRPWTSDIEIPTRAAHPGDNAFFVSVYGRNATYSIAFWRGRENCHEFTGAGRNDGLDFCAGLVPYATWRWDNYHNLDNEARCFFEELYQSFRVQPCWTGVSTECNSTLQAFACYESFHACDQNGFSVGTCRSSCAAVVYECANWFESVDLEHYNCTSSRYLDDNARVCTGSDFFTDFAADTQTFLAQPELLLYESKSSASSIVGSSLFALILVFVFFAW